jgi:hypothetical protein
MAGEEIVRIGSRDLEGEVRRELDHHLGGERQRRYVLAVSMLAGILFGLAPALANSRAALFSITRGTGTSLARGRLRHVLISAQVAVSLTLMIAGGLLVRSASQELNMETGYEAERVVSVRRRRPSHARSRDPHGDRRSEEQCTGLDAAGKSPSRCLRVDVGEGAGRGRVSPAARRALWPQRNRRRLFRRCIAAVPGYCAGRQLAAVPAGAAHRSTRGTQRSVTRRDELWKTRVPFSLMPRVVTELAVASTAANSV